VINTAGFYSWRQEFLAFWTIILGFLANKSWLSSEEFLALQLEIFGLQIEGKVGMLRLFQMAISTASKSQ
jgi:hypothetical protein